MAERGASEVRRRLLAAATALFYAEGLRAVGVERIVEHARTTKVSFYRHFRSKDDLVVAYLRILAEAERAGMRMAIDAAGGDPHRALELLAEQLETAACATGFRGCAFINAAAEYPDAGSGVRRAVEEHRDRCRRLFEEMIGPLGLADPEGVAAALMLLRDGVMVSGYLDHRGALAASFLRSSRALTAAGAASAVGG
ncbi:TetR/AcrR family transcriptional regulator [Amnibacterium setariae]|uniref:TetR/AcrR family transcriptional regulator n=1 Tax=Amnibacterium setariae TaxID=2306585 RepID=A0A3A1TWE5_9MICO|nr:TetR/AcrR family transcriptional regulator [Amnibacterium setariae]RIX28563.1 TetR/AcrR family transcriptional regulator [Amnibacterium setariae]